MQPLRCRASAFSAAHSDVCPGRGGCTAERAAAALRLLIVASGNTCASLCCCSFLGLLLAPETETQSCCAETFCSKSLQQETGATFSQAHSFGFCRRTAPRAAAARHACGLELHACACSKPLRSEQCTAHCQRVGQRSAEARTSTGICRRFGTCPYAAPTLLGWQFWPLVAAR